MASGPARNGVQREYGACGPMVAAGASAGGPVVPSWGPVPPQAPTPRMERAHPLESTMVLLDRIRAGDAVAREQLLGRYAPILRAWAHGRLPMHARGLADTEDV